MGFELSWLVFSVDSLRFIAAANLPNILRSAHPSVLSDVLHFMSHRRVATDCTKKKALPFKISLQRWMPCLSRVTGVSFEEIGTVFIILMLAEFVGI